jgi:hypothetical protein
MRPLGHTEARDERASVYDDDERIFDLWTRYEEAYPLLHMGITEEECIARATAMLAPLAPPKQALDRLILRAYPHIRSMHDNTGSLLGLFVTGGLSLLPEKRIIHTLEMPYLHNFGYGLEKDLLITGTLGKYAGKCLRGRLENHGTLGSNAGELMQGTLINRADVYANAGSGMRGLLINDGWMGFCAGERMIGTVVNYHLMERFAGERMIGTFINRGDLDSHPAEGMIGSLVNFGTYETRPGRNLIGRIITAHKTEWVDFRGYPPFFLHDVKNPEDFEYGELFDELHETYGRYG